LILADGFPGNRSARTADDEAGEGLEFEEFKWRAVSNGIPKLATPACVTEGGEIVAFTWGWRCSVVVCFFVVMMREVIEGLAGRACIGVVRHAILTGTVEAF